MSASAAPIACLPMYDFVELRAATDALWAAIATRLAARGVAAPGVLLRGADLPLVWNDSALLLGQSCGYPLMNSLRGHVALLATPRYGAPGCVGAFYRSVVIVRAGDPARGLADLRGRRCAVNDAASNSGMNLLRAMVAPLAGGAPRFFSAVVMTGAHAQSIAAVANKVADVAAIDCVSWALLQRVRPEATRDLRVLAWTPSSPGLPLITAAGTDAPTRHALRGVLAEVAADPALASVRASLLLEGFEMLDWPVYEAILATERAADAAGYASLQ